MQIQEYSQHSQWHSHSQLYRVCIAGYRPTCNECGDPAGYLPKRDRGVTRPVYDCGQGNSPLGKVPGSSAGRPGAPNFPKGYALPLETPPFACMECQPSRLKGKTLPQCGIELCN